MSWSRLGSVIGTGTTAGVDTSGATFIAICCCGDSGGFTVTDSKGNTWTPLTAQGPVGPSTKTGFFYCINPTVGASHTFSGPQSYSAIGAIYYTGNTASPFDVENGAASSLATSLQPGSISPSENNELLLAAGGTGGANTNTYTVDSGFSPVATIDGVFGVTYGLAAYELIETSAAAKNPTLGWSGNSQASVVIASFKAATATSTVKQLAALGVG